MAPRLSLFNTTKGFDFKFMDSIIREQFVIGGTGVNIHKYLGPVPQDDPNGGTPTEPNYTESSIRNIQDLLFLENRDRKYDKDIIFMKGVYSVQDIDYDLSQFGLFLSNDTLFLSFHLQDMVQILGRKLLAGDVIELPHLKDDYALEDEGTTVLDTFKRYFVIQEGARSAEGFSQTWYPHIWRVKGTPLVDAQEYRDIIGNISTGDDGDNSIKDIMTTYQQHLEINKAIIAEAEFNTREIINSEGDNEIVSSASGYDTTHFWIAPRNEDDSLQLVTVDDIDISADSDAIDSSKYFGSPDYDYNHYLSGDGIPPNGIPVKVLTQFPNFPTKGEYVLRTDYVPNRLFIFNGSKWTHVEDNIGIQANASGTERFRTNQFNNKDKLRLADGVEIDARQGLSKALQIQEDDNE